MQTSLQLPKTTRLAGLWFGLIFGLSFAVFAWGGDALLLASSRASLAGVKFLFGLPVALLLGGLTGYLVSRSPSLGIVVAAWAVVGGLLGWLSGHLPFEGRNLAIWLINPHLRGETVFVFDYAAKVRTILVIGISLFLGAFSGTVEGIALPWAQDHTRADGHLGAASWFALLTGGLMAFLMAISVNSFINQPLRKPEQAAGTLIRRSLNGELAPDSADYRTIQPFLGSLTEAYRIHFVEFSGDKKSWFSAYVDAVFADGFLLRCATAGTQVIFCDDFTAKYQTWMDGLARFGPTGARPWLDEKVQYLVVEPAVLDWLAAHATQMSGTFAVSASPPQNGWLFLSARYDTGFGMTCRFHGAAPVIVDQCVAQPLP